MSLSIKNLAVWLIGFFVAGCQTVPISEIRCVEGNAPPPGYALKNIIQITCDKDTARGHTGRCTTCIERPLVELTAQAKTIRSHAHWNQQVRAYQITLHHAESRFLTATPPCTFQGVQLISGDQTVIYGVCDR